MTREEMKYICLRRNQFIVNMAQFVASDVDPIKLAESSDVAQTKLGEVIERIQSAGGDNLRVLDLTNVDNIANEELFTEDYDQLINFINVSKENIKTLQALDIDVNDMSFKDVSMHCNNLSKVPVTLAGVLMNTILNENASDDITFLYVNAIANICAERMNRERFLMEHDLIPPGKTANDVTEAYTEAYGEWIMNEAFRILMALKANPLAQIVIYPEWLEEFKQEIRDLLPVTANLEWLTDMPFEHVGKDPFIKNVQATLNALEGLTNDDRRNLYAAIWEKVAMLGDKNSVGQMALDSVGNKANIVCAVNLPEATAHIMYMASNDLYDKDGVIQDTTRYLMDMLGDIMEKLDIPYGDYTAGRILSTFVLACPFAIVSSMNLKAQDQVFMNVAQNLSVILQDILQSKLAEIMEKKQAEEAAKKGDQDGNA